MKLFIGIFVHLCNIFSEQSTIHSFPPHFLQKSFKFSVLLKMIFHPFPCCPFALSPKTGYYFCAFCERYSPIFDTYFIRYADSKNFHPVFGTLFHKSQIQLTQNTFWIMIWTIPVHRLFTNQILAGRKEEDSHEPESEEHVHRDP